MRKRDIQFCIESLSFFMGVGRITDEVASRIARMDKVLWEELEAVLVPEAKAETVQEQEPAPETKPDVVQTKPDDVPAKPAPVAETWLVKDRPECQKCRYRQDDICDYSGKTGRIRGVPIAECTYYKLPRLYKKICTVCGMEFETAGPKARVCPDCKKGIKPENDDRVR